MHYHTVIIGAGPAGLFAAQALGKAGKSVLVLERNEKAGKKLLITGAGQCNFTHAGPIENLFPAYYEKAKFLKKALLTFDNRQVMRYFEEAGVPYQIMPNGKVFPQSMKSVDILNALLRTCQKHQVTLKYRQLCEEIRVYDGIFTIETAEGKRYFGDHIILATGGKSFAHLGSDGTGYTLAQKLGHTLIPPRPALTDVRLKESEYQSLAGVSVKQVGLSIWEGDKKIKEDVEDLLFTHKGISGPVIINNSRWMKAGSTLWINYLYPRSYEGVKEEFAKSLAAAGKEEIQTYLKRYALPKKLINLLCMQISLDLHLPCAKVSREKREALVKLLTRCPFIVDTLGGFHIAMVTTGGIHLKEVNPTSMESRKQKGFYVIGEALDVDAKTGGYNLQAAFSTAYLAAQHIITK